LFLLLLGGWLATPASAAQAPDSRLDIGSLSSAALADSHVFARELAGSDVRSDACKRRQRDRRLDTRGVQRKPSITPELPFRAALALALVRSAMVEASSRIVFSSRFNRDASARHGAAPRLRLRLQLGQAP